ncbi:MAG: Gp37 family protein [Cyanobacteria bacterium P01_H01_bin.121]
MTSLALIEDSILKHITEPLQQLGVQIDNSPQSGRPNPRAKLIFFYEGSRFAAPEVMAAMVQERAIRFRFDVRLFENRSHREIYPILEAVHQYLTGFEPEGTKNAAMIPITDEYVANEQGAWFYSLTYGLQVNHLQKKESLTKCQ